MQARGRHLPEWTHPVRGPQVPALGRLQATKQDATATSKPSGCGASVAQGQALPLAGPGGCHWVACAWVWEPACAS
eukprot:323597-Chlamydomonas_euryale.AAC.2